MKSKTLAFNLAILLALVLLASACGSDDEGPGGSIDVIGAEFRTTPNDLGAAYLTITNGTDEPITLVGATSAEVARIELHESMMNDEGVMQMVARPDGFVVEPGAQVSLEPGGKHLMLFDPQPSGDDLDITLDFGATQIDITAALEAAGSDETGEMEMGEMEEMDVGDGSDAEGG